MDYEKVPTTNDVSERPGLHPAVRLTEQQRAAGFKDVCPHEHAEMQVQKPVDLSKVTRPATLANTIAPGPLPAQWAPNDRRPTPEVNLPPGWGLLAQKEHRVVDPRTGGMKNQKANRPDLVPTDFARKVTGSAVDDIVRLAISRLRAYFEEHGSTLCLVDAAAWATAAMGGELAARKHLADLYGAGALKYSDDNWKKGYAWSLSYSAALRHLDAIERGEMVDKESFAGMGIEVLHWACVWFHCAALWTFATKGLGTDDRPKPPVATALKPGQVIDFPGAQAGSR